MNKNVDMSHGFRVGDRVRLLQIIYDHTDMTTRDCGVITEIVVSDLIGWDGLPKYVFFKVLMDREITDYICSHGSKYVRMWTFSSSDIVHEKK